MSPLRYLALGAVFGLVLYKGEIISWYRIQEMFRFQSFHMYGVLASAVAVGGASLVLVRRWSSRSGGGRRLDIAVKRYTHGTWIGGLLFGMGWALTGACPGPLYAHVGAGTGAMAVALLSAITGTWMYGYLRPKLPH